jgi:hypothetical protein
MIKKKVFASSVLAMVCAGMATNVAARPQYASQFSVDCSTCHTSVFGGGELKAAARDAYLEGGVVPGLSDFVKGTQSQPQASSNTKPVISSIALEWDAEVGQTLTIPLSVTDAEQDAFQITGKLPSGSSLSAEYTADNGLPTVDFQWTPTDAQVNKPYTIKFKAKETSTTKKFSSAPVTAKVRVWPAGDRDQAYIKKIVISTSKWTADNLALKGKVTFNKLVTAAEKAVFLSRTDLTVNLTQGATGTGTAISSSEPIALDSGGNWVLNNIPLVAPFPCHVTVEFEGKFAARKITGAPSDCLK